MDVSHLQIAIFFFLQRTVIIFHFGHFSHMWLYLFYIQLVWCNLAAADEIVDLHREH